MNLSYTWGKLCFFLLAVFFSYTRYKDVISFTWEKEPGKVCFKSILDSIYIAAAIHEVIAYCFRSNVNYLRKIDYLVMKGYAANRVVFCRLYPFCPSPPFQCFASIPAITLLLTSTVSPARARLSIWLERLGGNKKEDECCPLSIQCSLSLRTTTIKKAMLNEVNK